MIIPAMAKLCLKFVQFSCLLFLFLIALEFYSPLINMGMLSQSVTQPHCSYDSLTEAVYQYRSTSL